MVSKRRDGVRGSEGKRGRIESWQVRSRLMEERSGFVNSARSQMCARGGAAGDATTISRPGCVGSPGWRIESPKVWRQREKVEWRVDFEDEIESLKKLEEQ